MHRVVVQLPSRQIIQWTPDQVFAALQSVDSGSLEQAADICAAILRDPVVRGVLSTRTLGMLGLTLSWEGPEPADWFSLAPEAELDRILSWGLLLGVGLGYIRLDGSIEAWHPRWVRQDISTRKWYAMTAAGEKEVTPGDGRWILYTPYGSNEPWDYGLWTALALPWLVKQFALHDRARASEVFGSALVLGKASEGSTEKQRREWLSELQGLSRSTRMVLPEGYSLELLEAQGQTWGIYDQAIQWADNAIIIAIAGQIVTTLGQSGFSRGDIHQAIANSLVKFGAETFSTTLADQYILPTWRLRSFPKWDIEAPSVALERSQAISAFGAAIESANRALAGYGKRLAAIDIAAAGGIPLERVAAIEPVAPPAPAPAQGTVAASEGDKPNHPAELAAQMTADGIQRCEHGCLNRCRLCGIERVREYALVDDEPQWAIKWRAIDETPLPVAASKRVLAHTRLLSTTLPKGRPVTEFRIFAYGPNVTDHGTFTLDAKIAARIAKLYRNRNLTIDLEHLSLDSESRAFNPDAMGYANVETRADGLWAVNVRWTSEGRKRLETRSQRYISPAFHTDSKGRISSLINVALTALPAMHQPALVAASKGQGMKFGKLMKTLAAAIKARKLDDGKVALDALVKCNAITPDMVKAALDAIASGDTDAAMQALTDMLATLVAGEAPLEGTELEETEEAAADPDPEEDVAEEPAMTAATKRAIAAAVKPLADEVKRLNARLEKDERATLLSRLNPGMRKALAGLDIASLRKVAEVMPEAHGSEQEPSKPAKKSSPFEAPSDDLVKGLRSMGVDIEDLRAYDKDPDAYIRARKATKGAQ